MHRDFLGIKKLHFNMIPIDFATVFATCDISDFQFMLASKITPYLWMLFHFLPQNKQLPTPLSAGLKPFFISQ